MNQAHYGFNDLNEQTDYTCPTEALANLLSKKWIPQIIELLNQQDMRFGQLHQAMDGSTPKMIKQQLTLLEQNKIVGNEKVTENNMLQSTYHLTAKGKKLAVIVEQMKMWGQRELVCP